VEDVGRVRPRIAAHAGDIAKWAEPWTRISAWLSAAKSDWEGQFALALDPKARGWAESGVSDHGACTMCGEFCAYKVMDDAMEKQTGKG
jgi:phosphomethylpyrimidine synthase